MKHMISSRIFGLVLGLVFVLGSGTASAHWTNPFAGSSGSSQGQTGAPSATLPPCPPLIDGQPEFDGTSGTVWEPGVNCSLQDAATASVPSTSTGTAASGQPLNTIGDSPAASSPSRPVPAGGGIGARLSSLFSSSGSTGQPQAAGPGQVPQAGGIGLPSRDRADAALDQIHGRVGLSYTSWPDYRGADQGAERAALLVDLTFGQNGFLNNDDGLGWRIFAVDALESKLSINWSDAQVFRDDTQGLVEVGNHMNLELDLVYTTFERFYELELTRPLNGLEGWTLAFSTGMEGALDTLGTWDASLGLTYASENWMKSYYGISAAEASASGLSTYDPGAGLRDVFLEASLDVPLGANWGMDVGASARRLMGPAADAPQVKDAGSAMDYSGYVGLYYMF